MSADKPQDEPPSGFIQLMPPPGEPTIAVPFYPVPTTPSMQPAEPAHAEVLETSALALASAQATVHLLNKLHLPNNVAR